VSGVRIGALAAEASCSRSTLYELAPSKEALLLLVLDRLLRRIMRRGGEAIERAADPVDRVRAMLTSGAFDFASLGPQFLEDVRQHMPTRRLFERRLDDGRTALVDLIDDAVSAGQFRPIRAQVVAEAVIAVVAHFSDPRLARSDRAITTVELADLVEVFIDGLRPATRSGA
jgi:AcrR family transcriptional regulator